MKRYYYADHNNQPQGPATFPDLKELWDGGKLNYNTRVFPEGATQWKRWVDVLKAETGEIIPVPETFFQKLLAMPLVKAILRRA
jgi:hypothetical protein